mmetsp:Transcript_45776/g.46273  ORF Transcript_45776/g.46273 Transcript_45776/m.46273 type:complete len:81 (+) Transcript_45776:129-371(+)
MTIVSIFPIVFSTSYSCLSLVAAVLPSGVKFTMYPVLVAQESSENIDEGKTNLAHMINEKAQLPQVLLRLYPLTLPDHHY